MSEEKAFPSREFLVLAEFKDPRGNLQISTYDFADKDERRAFAIRSMDALMRGWTVTTKAYQKDS